MTTETHELISKLDFMLDMGMRPSVALVREAIATIQRQDRQLAELTSRVGQLRLEVARWEREMQHVD